MFRSFADVQTADMLKLPRPDIEGGKPHVVAAAASPQLKAFVGTLVERAQRLRSGGVDPRVDNMLLVTTDGRKAALGGHAIQLGKHRILTKVAAVGIIGSIVGIGKLVGLD